MKKKIDMESYPRKAHFEYFSHLASPYLGLTADTDVTGLADFCRRNRLSFYTVFLHCAALAADGVPEFRRRIENGGIVEYDECPTSHVEPKPDGTYAYCTLRHHMPFAEYLTEAEAARKKAREGGSIEEDDDVERMIFVTCIPWLKYTALLQPTDGESNPRISWGKFEPDAAGRLMMPVSVLMHHALADGIHVALFFDNLKKIMEELTNEQPHANA